MLGELLASVPILVHVQSVPVSGHRIFPQFCTPRGSADPPSLHTHPMQQKPYCSRPLASHKKWDIAGFLGICLSCQWSNRYWTVTGINVRKSLAKLFIRSVQFSSKCRGKNLKESCLESGLYIWRTPRTHTWRTPSPPCSAIILQHLEKINCSSKRNSHLQPEQNRKVLHFDLPDTSHTYEDHRW